MEETIRGRLRRRIRWCVAIGLGGSVLPAFSMGFMSASKTHQIPTETAAIVYATGFLVTGGALLFARVTLCPACSARIGRSIGMSVAFPIFRKPANFCPYCGVHLDKPAPTKPIS
jgi:hypothetical protein